MAANPTATATTLPTATATATPIPTVTSTPTRAPVVLPTDTPATTTITVWENLPELQARQLAEDIAAFQDQFPYYVIRQKHYTNPENFIIAVLSGQSQFDVVLAPPLLLSSLWAAQQLSPMSNFFPPSFMDSFAAVTLSGATANNQVWGLPETTGFHLLLFYNKDLVDTPPATTLELLELGQTLTGESRWGIGVNSYDPLWVVPWLAPFEGELTDETGQPTLNTPAMEKSLALFMAWHNNETGIAPVTTYDEMQRQFLEGNLAMMISGDWAIGQLSGVPGINWGIAPLPAAGNQEENRAAAPLVLGQYWAVSQSATGNRALAASSFLEFITRPERQLAWAAKFGALPTRRQALNDPLIVNDAIRRVSALQMQSGQPVPPGVNPDLLLDAMRDPLRAVVDGEITPREAAELMQANSEQMGE